MSRFPLLRLALLCGFLLLEGLSSPLSARKIVIKLGTMAPERTEWHDGLLRMRQRWRQVSGGEVELRIYPGGALGDEGEMVRQLRSNVIQAVALSGGGLPRLDESIDALNLPMLFRSYEELDYVRQRVAPELERRMEKENYKILNWSDAGWVHFFTKEPARTPSDLKRMKLWTSAGDPETEKLFKDFGFQVVPLPATDMLTGLQTGLIEAIEVPPLLALANRSYQYADNMIDLKWVPLIAATVISTRAWSRIPEQYRRELLEASRKSGREIRSEIRQAGEEAVQEMKQRGLSVIQLNDAEMDQWRTEVKDAYPRLRGSYAPADLFDRVIRLRDDFRSRQ